MLISFRALCYVLLQRVAACCSVLQRVAVCETPFGYRDALSSVTLANLMEDFTLRCVAACCIMLQCVTL